MLKLILDRVKEPSTWAGLAALGSVFGYHFSPELSEHIVDFGVASAGLAAVVLKERGHKKPEETK
jgi:hypothetical protein